MNQRDIDKYLEMYSAGVISKKTLMEAAGLLALYESEMEHDGEILFEEVDEDDFLERTFPLGSLLRHNGNSNVGISLANKPAGKPLDGRKPAPIWVQSTPHDLWTVVAHRSGWTKIVSNDGQHAGWTFYVKDYFVLA